MTREALRQEVERLTAHVPVLAETTDRIMAAVDVYLLDQRRCHLDDPEDETGGMWR
ncbi:hypothetical protein BX265_6994 [Streptomyces sp. TLI_235]|nr:hypothetical protein [Streptomyces sp. TLI_235]PBC69657.1 hypothetical protein BX265_6994 [Streptomyces sp. TLI_235]